MIVKSMSRKTPSFSQLIDYMHKGTSVKDEKYTFYHNLHPRDSEQLKRDFEANSELLPKRKNGVYLYHEMISFTRAKNLNSERQKEILQETVREYLQERAPECMAYSVIHDDHKDHLHAHLVISSNIIDTPKRHRLAKSQYDKIKIDAEKRVLEQYPEMEQEIAINKRAKVKVTSKEGELKRRTGRSSRKDKVHEQLRDIFSTAKTKEELFSSLSSHGLAMSYRKGYSEPRFGHEGSKKHYRLKTLGLDTDYAQLADSLNMEEQTQAPDIDYSGGKGRKDSIKAHYAEKAKNGDMSQAEAKEWLAGDFSARGSRARTAKFNKVKADSKTVKDTADQTLSEKARESAREFTTGDFSARDARAFKKKTDEKFTQPQAEAERKAKEAWLADEKDARTKSQERKQVFKGARENTRNAKDKDGLEK